MTISLAVLTTVLLMAAGYAHWRLPHLEATGSGVMLARGLLILVGVAFGLVSVMYARGAYPAALVFLSGFGLVHLPTALILMLKVERGESPS